MTVIAVILKKSEIVVDEQKARLFKKGIEKFKRAHPISEYTCREKALDWGCLPLRETGLL